MIEKQKVRARELKRGDQERAAVTLVPLAWPRSARLADRAQKEKGGGGTARTEGPRVRAHSDTIAKNKYILF